jgi:predicted glycoside hydrolase/deacetylase ChbG (UPF0249 family)
MRTGMATRGGLIINADDLGIHPRINAGIVEAFERGILTSTTMLLTTPFLEETVRDVVRASRLPVGLHLSLTLGRALTRPAELPDLADGDGNLTRLSAAALLRLGPPGGRRRGIYDQIHRELDAQLAAARRLDVPVTHVDTHQHVHMNPHIFAIVETLAEKYGVKRVRMCREPLFAFELTTGLSTNLRRRNPLKLAFLRLRQWTIRPRLASPDRFFGVMYSGHVPPLAFARLLDRVARGHHVYEVAIHPGHPAPPGTRVYPQENYNAFIMSAHREAECQLLIDPGVRALVEARGLRLMSFADLP